MENKLSEKINEKLESIDSRLSSVDITLVKQQASLDEHIRRTHLLETEFNKIEAAIEPIKIHVNQMNGALKFLGIVSVGLAILSAIYNFFK